jgi:methyltransferase (TIGR00027 family)
MLRWQHQEIDGEPKILVDPLAGRLLGEQVLQTAASRLGDPHSPEMLALRSHVVLRSRFAEDRLASAVARGVSQLIVLGAGLDTFAYRQPEWARQLRIFEVDQPASQSVKRRCLARAGIAVPDNVEFAGVDFERVSLDDGLRTAGVDLSLMTFFTCLGVMMYLTEKAVDDLFAVVARFPAGSEIVYTYRQASDDSGSALARRVSELGEPWRFHIDSDALVRKLLAAGYERVEELDAPQAERCYFQGRSDGLRALPRRGIAAAVVGSPRRTTG